jgi:predicted RND superfamily exporter protein
MIPRLRPGPSAHLAEVIFRLRFPLCAVIIAGFVALAPLTNFTEIDNDISMWISKDDPVYQAYERFRTEFGGQRTLLIALRSDRLFTPASLAFIRGVTEDIERVETVERVQSLSTANVVRSLPETAGGDGGIEVRPLLDADLRAPDVADRVRRRALNDDLLRGDLVSEDGTVTAIVVSFDEDRIDDVRSGVIDRIHAIVDPRLPDGMSAFYNGSLEISETYNRITLENTRNLTPPILLLTVGAIFMMFRSWRITGLLMVAVLVSTVWTMGLFVLMGFSYNILASMLPPLVIILAIADDVHIVQHFNHELRATGDKEHAFKSSVQHLFVPLLGASGTTALGLLSLGTSDVVAVRSFGIGAAAGVMVDFVMSLVFVPTLLMLLKPETGVAPQERYLLEPMRRLSAFSVRYAKPVLAITVGVMLLSAAGIASLRVDTNHVNFFAEEHPLHQSADLIDRQLSGIYSFNVLLEGEPGSMKSPATLRRMEELRARLERLPFVKKVTSVADYVKRVNRELNGGDRSAAVVPASADAIAQELFVFELSDDGRTELERVVASDYSRSQVSVKLASMSSDLVFEQINVAEREAESVFAGSGISTTVTGSGRIFATLDHYLVVSQLSSFATAFVTVFAVIFVVFRSWRFGLLGIVANALPVCAILGLMGWLGISLNVATVMVASVALGVVDDDTIHFIGRFRREAAAGAGSEEAIELATMHEGRASLTTAIINSLGYGIMIFSSYKPTAWFGGLLALTMVVAFLAEVLVVPAVITALPRLFDAKRFARFQPAA